MSTVLTFNIVFQAIILMVCLFLVARQEADFSYEKVVYVMLGIVFINNMLTIAMVDKFGPLAFIWLLPIKFLVVVYMVGKYCWVSYGKAVLVSLIFTTLVAGHEFFMGRVFAGAMGDSESIMDEQSAEMEEAASNLQAVLQAQLEAEGYYSETRQVQGSVCGTKIRWPAVANNKKKFDAEARQKWVDAAGSLNVSALMVKGGQKAAMVQNSLVEEGDSIFADHEGRKYEWRLVTIETNALVIEPKL